MEKNTIKFIIRMKGGSGSGNFGHAGRKGQLGGSAPAGGGIGGGEANSAPLSKKNFRAKYPTLYDTIGTVLASTGSDSGIRSKINVGSNLHNEMDRVNSTLTKLKGKTLREVLPKNTKWDNFDETPDNDALEAFAIGTAQDAVARALGKEGKFAASWLDEVVEGKYSEIFFSY